MDITTQREAEDPGTGSGTDSGTASAPGTTDASTSGQYPVDEERLHRGGEHRMLAGVAVGLADYFDVIPEEGSDSSVAEDLLARERAR